MDERLQKIVDEAHVKYGLDNYQLGRSEIYKERDYKGKAFYKFNMEWFPKESDDPIEEDYNPDGTAIIEYNIQKEQFVGVSFVQGKSLSTQSHFPDKAIENVVTWLEQETGLTYGSDFKLVEERANYFRFESDIDGVRTSPNFTIEVGLDDGGKLITYHTYGLIPVDEEIKKSSFTLTLEEIEPFVKKQLQLVHYPSELENRFIPVYAMEEVFVAVGDARVIAFMDHERTHVHIDEVIEWDEPLDNKLRREEITFLCVASANDAFGHVDVDEGLMLTDTQIAQSKITVRDAFRTEYPDDTGLWQLENLQYREHFIEAHCKKNEDASAPFKRKVVVFIHPETMSVLNFIDNGALFEIFESFEPTEKIAVTHEEAFEKMLPYISLDPAYVYDIVTEKYIICGLLDAAEAVDAVTGEIISLSEL